MSLLLGQFNVSNKALSVMVGVSPSTVNRWAKDKPPIHVSRLLRSLEKMPRDGRDWMIWHMSMETCGGSWGAKMPIPPAPMVTVKDQLIHEDDSGSYSLLKRGLIALSVFFNVVLAAIALSSHI